MTHWWWCRQVVVNNVLFEDRGATLLWTVQRLPALRHLCIDYESEVAHLDAPVSDSNGLPRCKELVELRSRSLTKLKMWMLDGPLQGNTLRLSGLPELRSCTIITDHTMPLSMCIDAASFQGVSQLQNLHIDGDERLALQLGCLEQLSALTSLALVQCGLRGVPASIASLSALRELDLGHNARMQLDGTAVASILQCSSLRAIGLHKPNVNKWEDSLGPVWQQVEQHMAQEGFVPAQYSVRSLESLLYLPYAFRKRHNRDLHVCLDGGGICGGMHQHGYTA